MQASGAFRLLGGRKERSRKIQAWLLKNLQTANLLHHGRVSNVWLRIQARDLYDACLLKPKGTLASETVSKFTQGTKFYE